MAIPKILGSSTNPEQLALTIKGILLTCIPVIVLILGGLKVTVDPSDLESTVNTLFGIFTLGVTLVGLVRKIYVAIKMR